MALCRLTEEYQSFKGTYCLHIPWRQRQYTYVQNLVRMYQTACHNYKTINWTCTDMKPQMLYSSTWMQFDSHTVPPQRLSAFTYRQDEVAHTGTGSASCSLGRSTWMSGWVSRCLTASGTPDAAPHSPARCNRRHSAGGWSGYVATSRGTSLQATRCMDQAAVTGRHCFTLIFLLRSAGTYSVTGKSASTSSLTEKSYRYSEREEVLVLITWHKKCWYSLLDTKVLVLITWQEKVPIFITWHKKCWYSLLDRKKCP
jgi:hypothetical protein